MGPRRSNGGIQPVRRLRVTDGGASGTRFPSFSPDGSEESDRSVASSISCCDRGRAHFPLSRTPRPVGINSGYAAGRRQVSVAGYFSFCFPSWGAVGKPVGITACLASATARPRTCVPALVRLRSPARGSPVWQAELAGAGRPWLAVGFPVSVCRWPGDAALVVALVVSGE